MTATTAGYESAVGSEGDGSNLTSPRKRSGSEGDLSPLYHTSTPDIREGTLRPPDRPRSDSSLLRIKAQLRAAAAADLETSVRAAEEPKESDDDQESIKSDLSSTGGGNLHDMPRMANTLLQQTKSKLEESRNLNREIREAVTGGLHGLHEMILRLADSRNLHIAEKERLRSGYERRLAHMEARHATAIQALANKNNEVQEKIMEKIQATFKEAEAARWLIYELDSQGKEANKMLANITDKVSTIQVAPELENRNISEGSVAKDVRTLMGEVTELRREWRTGTAPIAYSEAVRAHISPKDAESYTDTSGKLLKSRRDQLTALPHYPLMVESVDPRQCGEDILTQIKTKVDVISLGVGVNRMRKLRNQKVMISCDSDKDRIKLREAINRTSDKLTVSQPNRRNPLLKLIGVANDLNDKRIEEAIIKQNQNLLATIDIEKSTVKVLRRTKARSNALSNVIVETSPQIWKAIADQKIRLGFQIVRVADHSPLIQCYNCLGFGHRANDCREEVKCGHCSGAHDTRVCGAKSGPPRCINCTINWDHPAYSQTCPEWQKWDNIARSAVTYC